MQDTIILRNLGNFTKIISKHGIQSIYQKVS